jgi:hypothetical protein
MSERVLSASFISPVALTAPSIEQEKAFQLKKTKPEDELLFVCTRQNFLDGHEQRVLNICRKHKIDWALIYSTAKLHGVAPLVYANLRWCQNLLIPPEILERFRLCLMHNILVKERLAENITRAISFFAERSINVMLIKGIALDILVYDQPYYTVLQDADIAISVRREEITDRQYREFMEFFHESGVEYDYFSHHNVVMHGVLPVDFQQIWTEASKIEFRGQDVFVMSPEDMLLSLCINSCRKRFFRLKALCDIAETINKYPGLDWSKLVQRARAYDCYNIIYTVLLVTVMTMGCSLPEGCLMPSKSVQSGLKSSAI